MASKPSKKPTVAIAQRPGQNLLLIQTISDLLTRSGQRGKLGKQFGDKRDLYNVLGYTKTPTIHDYWNYFLREDICKRIVVAPATATWRCAPEIRDSENPDRETEFEKAWDELAKTLNVWSYFSRADKLAGIGYFGVMLLGLRGKLDAEVKPGTLKFKNGGRLLYLSTFSQRHASVAEYEESTISPRFGRPLYYEIDVSGDLNGVTRQKPTQRQSAKLNQSTVHWTRVLHFADGLLEDEVYGTPRLEAVFNRMYDLQKVVGGSGEMYWRGAYGGFALEAAENVASTFAGSGAIDEATVDEFAHGMRRWIDLEGYTMQRIEGQDVKPKEVFDTIISLVASATGIPQRILLGSERGELASSQDETNWKDLIEERREEYAEPLIRDFINRLILWGILPEPTDGNYEIDWPSLYTTSEKDESEIFRNYAEGISKIAPGGQAELIVTPKEIRTKFLKLEADPDESLEIDPLQTVGAEPQPPDDAGGPPPTAATDDQT